MSEPAQAPLQASDLLAHAPLRRIGRSVLCLPDIDSTNRFLLDHAHELPDGTIVTAEWQSAGRGRFSRRWEAPRGASILLSGLMHEPEGSDAARLASTVGAVAACEAIRGATDCEAELRWPNDVLIRGRKVAGVLVETRRLAVGTHRAIALGIGINCWQQSAHFPPALRDKATSLELCTDRAVSRRAVAAELIRQLDQRITQVESDGAAPLLATWRRLCGDVGRRVTLRRDGATFEGVVIDLDAQGALLVQLDVGGRLSFDAARTTRIWDRSDELAS